MILPINHIANWKLICQRKQVQIEKDILRENSTIVNHDYRIGEWVKVRKEITLNMKHHLKVRMTLFRRGKMELLPFKWERSQID